MARNFRTEPLLEILVNEYKFVKSEIIMLSFNDIFRAFTAFMNNFFDGQPATSYQQQFVCRIQDFDITQAFS